MFSFGFFNNLMTCRLMQITSRQDSTSVSGFIQDWVAASQYRRAEISFNVTIPSLSVHSVARDSSKKPKHWTITLSRMIHSVSIFSLNFFLKNSLSTIDIYFLNYYDSFFKIIRCWNIFNLTRNNWMHFILVISMISTFFPLENNIVCKKWKE